jgi:hypothetical protein
MFLGFCFYANIVSYFYVTDIPYRELASHHVNIKGIDDITVLIETTHLRQCANQGEASLLNRTS